MNKVITGLFNDYADAQRAVRELELEGYADAISILTPRDPSLNNTHPASQDHSPSAITTAVETGAAVGAAGGLLAGLTLLTIPAMGPLFGAGWLTIALLSTGLGTAGGTFISTLIGSGIPVERAEDYHNALQRGATLIAVRTTESGTQDVARIMNRHNATQLDHRSTTINPAEPYPPTAPL